MVQKTKVIVLSAKQTTVTEQGTGKVTFEATQVQFVCTTELVPVEEGGVKGYMVAKANEPLNAINNFVSVPAIYEADYGVKIGGDGKAKLAFSNFKYICDLTGEAKK